MDKQVIDEAATYKKTVEQELAKKNVRPQVKTHPSSNVLHEFKQWKKTIIDMVRLKSSLQFYDDNNYKFILPPGLVRLVWDVTINERINAQNAQLPQKEKIKKAYESLQQDLVLAQSQREQFEKEKVKASLAAKAIEKPVEAPKPAKDKPIVNVPTEPETKPVEPSGA